MLKILPIACILISQLAFCDVPTGHENILFATRDTIAPVAPQRVFIISPNETNSFMAAQLQTARELKIEDSKEGYRVVRFTMVIDNGNSYGSVTIFQNMGSQFSAQILNALRNVKPKYFITIEDIEIVSRTGQRNRAYPRIINVN